MLYTPWWSSFIPKYPLRLSCCPNLCRPGPGIGLGGSRLLLSILGWEARRDGMALSARVGSPKKLMCFWCWRLILYNFGTLKNWMQSESEWVNAHQISIFICFCWLGFKKIVHVRGFVTITNTFRNQLRPTVCFLLTTWLRMATRRKNIKDNP